MVFVDGQRMEGEFILEDAENLYLRVAGVAIRLDRARIERVYIQDPPQERYRKMRALIKDDDTDRLVLLADWLQRRKMYAEALHELEQALKADPNNTQAQRLRRVVTELRDLEERAGRNPGAVEIDRQRQTDAARRFPQRPGLGEFPLLRPEQINLIKVYETDLRDPPKLVADRRVIDRIIRDYAASPLIPPSREGRDALYHKSPEEILDLLFRLRARELYELVQVVDSPRSMRQFRDQVHASWLVNSCASTRCHGGFDGGRLLLTNYRPTSDASVYTNFLILERFKTRDGRPLIDYAQPENSVLLQMALPRDDSASPHPVVPGWSPVFRSRENRRFLQAIEWIRMMYRPRPTYPIEYTPPGEATARSPEPQVPGEKEPVER